MRSEWREVMLKDIVDFNPSEPLKRGTVTKKIGMADIIEHQRSIPSYEEAKYTSGTRFRNGDTLFARITPSLENGKIAQVNILDEDEVGFGSTEFIVWRYKDNISDPNFLFYLANYRPIIDAAIKSMVGTSGRQRVQLDVLQNYQYTCPPLSTQKAIADTLSCLDAKIEVNNRIIKNLEEQAQAIFKSWFIDFEPFQEGEFVESELGMIPEGWAVGTIDDIIELHDSKRVPLSSREREGMAKIYPYYGAASLMDYVDDYIFDGTYLLLGEDGTVVDDLGYPILQYVYGKIWVNNHAHVITGKNGYTVEHLYMLFRNTNVHSAVTGAVQKKINQRNLKSLQVILPPREIVGLYNDHIAPAFSLRKTLEQQNTTLATLRDTLLPKLMSGEVEVPIERG